MASTLGFLLLIAIILVVSPGADDGVRILSFSKTGSNQNPSRIPRRLRCLMHQGPMGRGPLVARSGGVSPLGGALHLLHSSMVEQDAQLVVELLTLKGGRLGELSHEHGGGGDILLCPLED